MKEELAKISFSNIGHCVNTNLILDYITNLQEEIERLKEINKELGRDYSRANNGYLRLHSIIKEVREYIKEWQRFPHTNGSTHKELQNIIGILDKES